MKIILLVLDSVGIGALPDAHLFNDDSNCNTLGNIFENVPNMKIPNLTKLGIGNIDLKNSLPKVSNPIGAFGKAAEVSKGKDTTTGHWEICGIKTEKGFPTFPNGFPEKIISLFEKKIGCISLGNIVGSGTEIIEEYGNEHIETGYPIVYTSADSVFQIAMHEDIIPIQKQYDICKKARNILVGDFEVSRVIARPFIGTLNAFHRTTNRKDFAIPPPKPSLLNLLKDNNYKVKAVGKIDDIFSGSGITEMKKAKGNLDGINKTISLMKKGFNGLVFTNLIDFDMDYGHRRDVYGYAKCLEEFDAKIPELMNALSDEDVLIITADHGNDPTAKGTDHTREYIPILVYGKRINPGIDLGTRNSFADIGATVAEAFDLNSLKFGESFWKSIIKRT